MPDPLEAADAPHGQQELLVGCILLLLAEERSHGYGLPERVKQLMPRWDLSPGNLYRELRRMAADGLVVSVWEASQTRGPARRVYEITEAGRAALDQWVLGLEDLIRLLDSCISLHHALPPPGASRRRRKHDD